MTSNRFSNSDQKTKKVEIWEDEINKPDLQKAVLELRETLGSQPTLWVGRVEHIQVPDPLSDWRKTTTRRKFIFEFKDIETAVWFRLLF